MSLTSSTFNVDISKQMAVDTSGHNYYNWQTFKYFEIAMTWKQAKAYCEMLGGHLATSISSEKNEFLLSLSNNNPIHLGCSYNS